jgi:septation ring formation regulator EzrA
MAATHEDTFTAYLEQVRAHRAELRESVAAVDDALVDLHDRDDWLQRLHTALVELAHDFTDHVDLTERPGGLYDTVRARASRLAPAVDRLSDDHVHLREEIATVIGRLEQTAADHELEAVRDELSGLVERLVRHRQRGGELVYEAFAVDLGGSG